MGTSTAHSLLECVFVGLAPPPASLVFGFEEGDELWLAIRDFDEADVYPPVVPFLSSAGHYHVDLAWKLAWKNDHLYARLWLLLNTLGRGARQDESSDRGSGFISFYTRENQ